MQRRIIRGPAEGMVAVGRQKIRSGAFAGKNESESSVTDGTE